MTLYAGEQIRILSTAADFDDVALADTDVEEVTVSIYTPGRTVEIEDEPMTWTDGEGWSYLWDSNPIPGDYQAKVVLTAVDGGTSWEWKRIRLVPNRVTVAP